MGKLHKDSAGYETDEILTFNEAKAFLKLSKPTLAKLIRECNDFPAIRVGGQWRFIRSELLHWLKERTKQSLAG